MRFLFVSGPNFVDQTRRLLEKGHEVIFLHVAGQDTPFNYKINFAQADRSRWVELINDFANTHNVFETHRKRYVERSFKDLDEIYGRLEDLVNEFSPDHVIRAERDLKTI